MKSEHNNCLICNSSKLKSLTAYEKYHLVKCNYCKFVFVKKIPSKKELLQHYHTYVYEQENYLTLSPITIKRYEELLNILEKYRSNNRILDVGCGSGFFLEVAMKRGWDVYGVEYSEKAFEVCKKKGIKMQQGTLNMKNYIEMEFDVITSFETIEHINNPQEEINSIYCLLRKKGVFYCTTPNFNALMRFYHKANYSIINYPDHLSYYTTKTISFLLERNNLKKIELYTSGINLARTNTNKSVSINKFIPVISDNERLRETIENYSSLQYAKKWINNILNILRIGDTIKVLYKK